MHNIVDDVSWIKGNHTFQFGTNIRMTRNSRVSYGNAFDNAVTNPSFYASSGAVVSRAIDSYLADQGLPEMPSVSEAQNAATALIGRYSQYTANFTFAPTEACCLPARRPTAPSPPRSTTGTFQDAWRMSTQLDPHLWTCATV